MSADTCSKDCQATIARTLDAIGKVHDHRMDEFAAVLRDLNGRLKALEAKQKAEAA